MKPRPDNLANFGASASELSHRRTARQAGIPVEEFERRLANEEKWCGACKDFHSLLQPDGTPTFARNRSTSDGLQSYCREASGQLRAVYRPRRNLLRHCRRFRCARLPEWKGRPHQHCPLDGCDRPMPVGATFCSNCETLMVLKAQLSLIQRNLQKQYGVDAGDRIFERLRQSPMARAQEELSLEDALKVFEGMTLECLPSAEDEFAEWHRERKERVA